MIEIDNENTAHDSYYVRASDTDLFFKGTVPFYFSIMQEMGASHAAAKKVAITDLMDEYGATWVISRTRVKFLHHASWQDHISVQSWAQEPVRLHCPRVIKGVVDGVPVFEAMTLWAVIDVKRARPIRPGFVLEKLIPADPEKHFMSPDLSPIKGWDETDKISVLEPYRAEPVFYNIDANGHINNVVYLEWIISAMDQDFLKTHEPDTMDVKWVRQTFASDCPVVETALIKEENGLTSFIHRIVNKDGKTVFEAESSWRDRA